jgi:hypothetical protein
MFDGVPKTKKVGRNDELMGQKLRVLRLNSHILTRIRDGRIGNIDSLHGMKRIPGNTEKKAVGTTDLKQVLFVRLRHKGQQSLEPKPKLLLDNSAIRNIVAIFVACKISGCIELAQLLFRQGEIGGREFALLARQ